MEDGGGVYMGRGGESMPLHTPPSSLLLVHWPPCSITVRLFGAGTAVAAVSAVHTPILLLAGPLVSVKGEHECTCG